MVKYTLEPSLLWNVGPEPAFFCVRGPEPRRGMASSSALGQGPHHVFPLFVTTEPTRCRRRNGAVCHRPTGLPASRHPSGKEHRGHEE
jgi:hypothetical protein